MTKVEFTRALAVRLAGLPETEIDRITAFYAEMADDRIEEGMAEEDAVAALGDVDAAARQAMMDLPLPMLMKSKVKESRDKADSKVLWIILAVLGFPLWFPLLISFAAVIFSLYITVWALIFALIITVFSIGIGGVAGLIGGVVILAAKPVSGIFALGASLVMIGIALFLIKPVILICKSLVKLTVAALRSVKRLFIPEGGRK
jgi:Predicted membrane protein